MLAAVCREVLEEQRTGGLSQQNFFDSQGSGINLDGTTHTHL